MSNIVALAARKIASTRAKDDDDKAYEDSKREQLETAVAEFESAKTAAEKVAALKAFVQLAND